MKKKKKINHHKIGDIYLGKYEIIGINKIKFLGEEIEELKLRELEENEKEKEEGK